MARIENADTLRKLIGSPSEMVPHKIHRDLNARAIGFIGKSPMLMLSTNDAQGQATVSPKGDPAGFVHVEDSRTLLIPERKGNKLIFSLTNGEEIAESGGIGRESIREFDQAVAGRYKTDL